MLGRLGCWVRFVIGKDLLSNVCCKGDQLHVKRVLKGESFKSNVMKLSFFLPCFSVLAVSLLVVSRKVHSKLISAAKDVHQPPTTSFGNLGADLGTGKLSSKCGQNFSEDRSVFHTEKPTRKRGKLCDLKVEWSW